MYTKPTLDLNVLDVNKNFAARDYWKDRLSDFYFKNYFYSSHVSELRMQESSYATCVVKAPEELKKSLSDIALTYKARHIVLLSALGIMIQKYAGVEDVCIFTPLYSSELNQDEKKHILPIRMMVSGDRSFKNFLNIVKTDLIRDIGYGKYAVERVFNQEGTGFKKACTIGMSVKEIQGSILP
ncbi:MAG: hypothetical protein ABIR18_14235, partial [Chitinophagaceae bacterium]